MGKISQEYNGIKQYNVPMFCLASYDKPTSDNLNAVLFDLHDCLSFFQMLVKGFTIL